MDYMLGSIMLSGINFAPRDWAYCQGQSMTVQQNMALYSLLGTQFGGTPNTSFNLPNLSGRAPIGTGYDPTLSSHNYVNGEKIGTLNTTLTQAQLPAHIHTVAEKVANQTVKFGTASATSTANNPTATATATVKASSVQAGANNPSGGYWAKGYDAADQSIISSYSNTNNVTMASDAVTVNVSNINVPISTNVTMSGQSFNAGNLQTGITGANQPFSTMQPSLAISYIICTNGLYPSRPD